MRGTLTPQQRAWAERRAAEREAWNRANGIKPKYGAPDDPALGLRGLYGETAVCLVLQLPHTAKLKEFKAKDVGGIIEVKAVGDANHSLIMHPSDREKKGTPFVLVHIWEEDGEIAYHLLGWQWAEVGTTPKFWRTRYEWRDGERVDRSAYFVRSLKPMQALVDLIPSLLAAAKKEAA